LLCSIYGGMRFADEDLSIPHRRGSVVMANAGCDDAFLFFSCEILILFLRCPANHQNNTCKYVAGV